MKISRTQSILALMILSIALRSPATSAADQSHYSGHNEKKPRVIVFVHGVVGKPIETWTARNGAYWPNLIARDLDFQLSDIFVAQYRTFIAAKSLATQSIDEDASVVWEQLRNENVWGDHREVVFVCHSLGGLVVERMLILHPEIASQVPFLVSFGTPHQGSYIARLASLIGVGGSLAKSLSATDDNAYLIQLDSDWRNAGLATIKRFCAFEGQDTPLPDEVGGARLGSVRVVPYFSATYDCDTSTPVAEVLANHYEIVKPVDRNSVSYAFVKRVYQDNPVTVVQNVQRS